MDTKTIALSLLVAVIMGSKSLGLKFCLASLKLWLF